MIHTFIGTSFFRGWGGRCLTVFLWLAVSNTLLGGVSSLQAKEVEYVSAPPHLSFSPLQVDSESSVLGVTSFHQDSDGFLWIGTERGLRRYDGYDLHLGNSKPAESLSQDAIVSLTSDAAGQLWAGTSEGEIHSLDPAIIPPTHAVGAVPGMTCLLWDARGTLWIGSMEGLVERPSAGQERHHRSPPQNGGQSDTQGQEQRDEDPEEDLTSPADSEDEACRLEDEHITSLLEDSQGTLWVGTEGGLHRYDRVQSCFQSFRHDPSEPRSLSSNHVTALLEDSQGTLWVGTAETGLDRMLGGDGQFFHLRVEADDPLSLPDDRVTVLFEDSLRQLWVGTAVGLSRLQISTGRFDRYAGLLSAVHGLPGGSIRAIYEDRAGTLWVGADDGVASLPALRRYFRHYLEVGFEVETDLRETLTVYEDLNRRLWVGTARQGLFVIDHQRRLTRQFYQPSPDDSADAMAVPAIVGNGRGEIWMGTAGAGVWWRHPESRLAADDVLKPLPHQGRFPEIDQAMVNALTLDGENLWIGTAASGLYRFDKASRQLTSWRHIPDDERSLASNDVTVVYVDRFGSARLGSDDLGRDDFGSQGDPTGEADDRSANRGDIWLGTRDAGLDRLGISPEGASTVEHFGPELEGRWGRHALTVNDLFEDGSGTLWVATEGGLLRVDPSREEIDSEPRLGGRPIKSLVADLEGYLWVSSEGGLWRLPIQQQTETVSGGEPGGAERIERFTVEHGLQGARFSVGAAFHGRSDEELFFGGEKGISVFSPQLIVLERPAPPVVLTRVMVEGQARPLHRDAWEVTLDSEERQVQVEVAALDFVRPKGNQYAFFLEGEDRGWIETGSQRYIRYSHLSPGDYTLHVAASHADGVWNREGLRLDIRVAPKLRQRPAFQMLLAFLAAVGITLMVMIWDRGRHRRQMRLRELEIEGKQRLLGAQEDERSRLAREIHDGALTILPSLVTQLDGRVELGADEIRTTADRLRETSAELHEISARLHSPVLGRFGLAAAIRERLDRLRREHPRLEIQLDLAADGQRLSEPVRLALFRVFEHSLDNAVHHGDPSWIRIVLELSAGGCCLRIIDDGRGFRVPMKWVQLLRGKHQGLLDMVERAESVGGRCYVRSVPRRGTEVRVIAPFKAPTRRRDQRRRR